MTDLPAHELPQPNLGKPSRLAFLRPLAARDFRLLWLGESVSLLGDQFYLVALPWLTFQITGSGLALGTVLMVEAIPRLLFMLVGGALADRWSPRALMLASNATRALLAGGLAVLALINGVAPWLLYFFAFAFGVADAFFQPAMLAIVPRLVAADELQPSNALLQITGQMSAIIGPALAGLVIAGGATWVAFAADAATFVFTSALLLRIRPLPASQPPGGPAEPHAAASLGRDVLAGLGAIWRESQMRVFLLLLMAINFFMIGPMSIGLPVLAAQRFGDSAAAFGAMLTSLGVGALLGTLLAGAVRPPRALGVALLGISAAIGASVAILGVASNLILALGILGVIGGAAAFINIHILSWLQRRTPAELLGRVMSVVLLAALGLDPLSRAAAGVAIDYNTGAMFAVAGVLLAALALLSPLSRAARSIG
jgi:hypothetical protein